MRGGADDAVIFISYMLIEQQGKQAYFVLSIRFKTLPYEQEIFQVINNNFFITSPINIL